MRKILYYICLLSLSAGVYSCDWLEAGNPGPDLQTGPDQVRQLLESRSGDLSMASETQELYKQRSFVPLWENPRLRQDLMQSLQTADEEGLSFEAYHAKQFSELFNENQEDLDTTQAAYADILLTDALLRYGHDLYYGRLEPEKLHRYWGVKRKDENLVDRLLKGVEEKKITETLEELKPSHPVYRDLKKSLEEYQDRQQEDDFKKIPSGKLVRPGDKDPRIEAVAQRLHQLGFLDSVAVEKTYSARIEEAVRAFQKDKGLEVDGFIGNSTIDELNMSETERYKQILANLERWRWYPRDLGEHYILINIPQFRLAVVKDGDTVRTHNVIAGTVSRQTPIFTDTIRHVVINPEWTIPPTIKTKDIIPKVAKDPSYLARQNMSVLGKDGKKVDPSSVDWSDPEARSYTIVQRSGPTNPLGRVKIIYPNRFLVYLHDTPAQNLFSQNQRAESSGCVRVENAVDLSGYVLRDQEEWNEERIQETIKSGKTVQVQINQPIQVHHFYWTAWRAGNETVFTEDVYNLDEKIYSRLLEGL